MGVEDEVARHSTTVVSKRRTGRTNIVPTVVSDPPQVGGVKAVVETGN